MLWKDRTTEWVSLKALKQSNPVELVEYAKAHHIDNVPAFYWWVRDVLWKQQRIIGKLKSKYWCTMHKFCIRLPEDTREALQIDEDTGMDFWKRVIEKELQWVKVAWEACNDLDIEQVCSGKQHLSYTEIVCHMVFDVKIDFICKARFVAGGHLTDAPDTITYSSVFSCDSVRIALLLAELNGLDIMVCDVGNANLNAPCREKV